MRSTSAGPEAPEAVAQLAERSLVMRVPGRRHVLLETLRAYGETIVPALRGGAGGAG